MYDAAFFDFDGTLQSFTTQSVPDSAIRALQLLRDKGLKVILATGRHKSELESINKLFTFDAYITLNGQYCYDHNGVFRKLRIPREDVLTAVKLASKNIFPCYFVEDEIKYVNYIDDAVLDLCRLVISPAPIVHAPERALNADVLQLCVYLTKEKEHLFLDHVKNIEVLRWYPTFFDAAPKGGGKQHGIEAVMTRYNLTPTRIMAFGDGENDIAMLQYAHTGVAMGNANPEVKAVADHITDSVDSHGILHAVEMLLRA